MNGRVLRIAVAACLAATLAACGDEATPPGGQLGEDGGMTVADTGPGGSDDPSTRPKPSAPTVANSTCTPGDERACTCTSQAGRSLEGTQVCTTDDEWTACTCTEEWPYLGPMCGSTECPVLEEGAGYGGQHCCTGDGRCGLTSREVFAAENPFVTDANLTCLARDDYPVGVDDDSCLFEIPFVQMNGCCRPDNKCGMYVAAPNWKEFGCIERTEWGTLLEPNTALFFFLLTSDAGLLGRLKTSPASCTYPQ